MLPEEITLLTSQIEHIEDSIQFYLKKKSRTELAFVRNKGKILNLLIKEFKLREKLVKNNHDHVAFKEWKDGKLVETMNILRGMEYRQND